MNTYGQEAITYLKNGDITLAEKRLKESFQEALHMEDEQAIYDLVQNLQQLGFIAYAIEMGQQAQAIFHDEEWDLLLAELYMDNSQFDDALDILLTISENSPVYPSALLMLAELYQLEELYEVSEIKLQHAKTILPDEPVIDLAFAELYRLMGEYEKSVYFYQQIETAGIITPEDLHKRMARVLIASGELEDALTHLENISRENHDSDSLFELGLAYYQLHEYERSIKWFEELLAKDPDYLSANHFLARALLETKQDDKAMRVLETAVKQDPYQASLYVELYYLYASYKLEQERIELLQAAQTHVPDDTALNVLYAHYLKEKEDYETLVDFAKTQLEDDEDSEYYWLLAYAYGKLEEDDDAQYYYGQAYEMFREDVQFLEDYALYLREIGKKEQLEKIVSDIKRIVPDWDWQ